MVRRPAEAGAGSTGEVATSQCVGATRSGAPGTSPVQGRGTNDGDNSWGGLSAIARGWVASQSPDSPSTGRPGAWHPIALAGRAPAVATHNTPRRGRASRLQS